MAALDVEDEDGARATELMGFYRDMLRIRRFEEKAGQLYGMGLIGGFCHLYIGQEAVVTGIEACLRDGDKRLTSYRCHGHMLMAGMDPKRIMAEMLGREDGYSRGRGGSMHMFSPEHGFFGGHGIVGAQVPIGAGLALAEKTLKTNKIVTCYFGDAAADQGQVAETYLMAARWQLPVLFVIENNKAEPGQRAAPKGTRLIDRAHAYGIEGAEADGMDVLAMKETAERFVLDIRAGKGPRVIEAKTYRYRGHSMADPAKYRTRDELHRMRAERDPIEQVRQMLLRDEGMSEDDLKAVDKEIKAEVSAAAEHARGAAEPASDALHDGVYAHV
ncbi:pyruvate dehydrogenase (acetyl-transferring) E1 component subunit alpha [Litorisediminicola beolgyonensis]|uniref:Pyruvate dehydrogenase E1 component subunit alpha n=1 Tax=Litorisediminicola beolgyonensis TaxID=1173614 RepID=A0ABW3ZEF7_9RHOB